MKKIVDCPLNIVYQVHSITGCDETSRYLQRMGIVPTNKVTLLKIDDHMGILSLQNSRFALARELLDSICVEEIQMMKQWLSLDQLAVGEQGKVVSIYGEGPIRRRLMDMGITQKINIRVHKLAPLGDPIEVTLRGYELSLRKDEAALILVEKEETL
ncbi:ferrous iron transport protein A [Enterococcus olivae]